MWVSNIGWEAKKINHALKDGTITNLLVRAFQLCVKRWRRTYYHKHYFFRVLFLYILNSFSEKHWIHCSLTSFQNVQRVMQNISGHPRTL